MSTSREVMETWFRRVWTEEDSNAIEELFVPDGKARGLGANVLIGPEGFKQFHSALRGLLCDFVITIDKSIEVGDWISAVCTLRAKSRQSGAPVQITGSVMITWNGWQGRSEKGDTCIVPMEATWRSTMIRRSSLAVSYNSFAM